MAEPPEPGRAAHQSDASLCCVCVIARLSFPDVTAVAAWPGSVEAAQRGAKRVEKKKSNRCFAWKCF